MAEAARYITWNYRKRKGGIIVKPVEGYAGKLDSIPASPTEILCNVMTSYLKQDFQWSLVPMCSSFYACLGIYSQLQVKPIGAMF